ncbi:MAG: helix-turn-helix domain-containing protein [Planctomycetes bacterium]|nr:helix-turn-helix domain-containing protein [Planctomycetota bacterium]
MSKSLTTSQAAKICDVSPRTIANWIDKGFLPGYRIPESKDRRVSRRNLYQFLKHHGMPLGELEDDDFLKVLLIGTDARVCSKLIEFTGMENFKVKSASSVFDAGIQTESLRPDCVIIDFALGRNEALLIFHNIKQNSKYVDTVLIGLLSDEDNAYGVDRTLFNETFRKPFDTALLAERIQTLVGRI